MSDDQAEKLREFTRLLNEIDWASIPESVWMPEGDPYGPMDIPHRSVSPKRQYLGTRSALTVVPDEMESDVSARIYYEPSVPSSEDD